MLRFALAGFAAVSASAFAGQNGSRPLTTAERAVVKQAFDGELKDPASAQFRLGPDNPKAKAGWKDEKYCGFVNAKNAYGAYTGYKLFAVFVKRNPSGRIIEASFPSISGSEGSSFEMRLSQATARMCNEAGYEILL